MNAYCCFFCIAYLFYIYQTCIFCNSHEIHFGTITNSLLWNHVSVNKIIIRLVKLYMQKTNKTNCIVRYGTPIRAVVMAMGLLYRLALWSVCVWEGFRSNDSWPMMQSFPMDGHYRTNVISGVGHSRSDLVMTLVLRTICFCAMAGAPALYYRSLGTASTLLRRGNISGRP